MIIESIKKSTTETQWTAKITRFHDPDRFILRVMGHVGRRVEEVVDAVSAVGSDHGVSVGLSVLLNDVAQLAVFFPGFHHLYGGVETFPRNSNQLLRFFVHLTHEERLVQIAVIA